MEKLVIDTPGFWVYERQLAGKHTSIGRRPSNDIVLSDSAVSAAHAVISKEGEVAILEDLGSSNGTYVNGERVQRHILTHNDQIVISKYAITYVCRLDTHRVDIGFLLGGMESAKASGREDLVQRIKESLGNLPEPQENLDAVLSILIRTTGAENGYIMLVDPGSSSYVVKASKGIDHPIGQAVNATFSHTVADTVVRQGETVLSRRTDRDDRFSSAKSVLSLGIVSALCTPIRLHSAVIGVIYLDTRSEKVTFNKQDQKLVEDLADTIAWSLEQMERRTIRAAPRAAAPAPAAAPPVEAGEPAGVVCDWTGLTRRLLGLQTPEQAVPLLLAEIARRASCEVVCVAARTDSGWKLHVRSASPLDRTAEDELLQKVAIEMRKSHGLHIDPRSCKILLAGEDQAKGIPFRGLRLRAGRGIRKKTDQCGAILLFEGPMRSPAGDVEALLDEYVGLLAEVL